MTPEPWYRKHRRRSDWDKEQTREYWPSRHLLPGHIPTNRSANCNRSGRPQGRLTDHGWSGPRLVPRTSWRFPSRSRRWRRYRNRSSCRMPTAPWCTGEWRDRPQTPRRRVPKLKVMQPQRKQNDAFPAPRLDRQNSRPFPATGHDPVTVVSAYRVTFQEVCCLIITNGLAPAPARRRAGGSSRYPLRSETLASLEGRLALFLHRRPCVASVFTFLDLAECALCPAGLFGRP